MEHTRAHTHTHTPNKHNKHNIIQTLEAKMQPTAKHLYLARRDTPRHAEYIVPSGITLAAATGRHYFNLLGAAPCLNF